MLGISHLLILSAIFGIVLAALDSRPPGIRMASQIYHPGNYYLSLVNRIKNSVRKSSRATPPRMGRNLGPGFWVQDDTLHGSFHFIEKLQAQSRRRAIVVFQCLG